MLTDEGIRAKWGLPPANELSYLSCDGQVACLLHHHHNHHLLLPPPPPPPQPPPPPPPPPPPTITPIHTSTSPHDLPRPGCPIWQVATIEEMNDTKEFAAVTHALGVFRFDETEIAGAWRMLASVLLLGNVQFQPQAKVDGGGDEEIAEVRAEGALVAAVAALGTDAESLRSPLLCKNIKVMRDTIVAKYTVKAAEQARDALAKAIFAALFDTIVARVNDVSASTMPSARSIGILDIFGFESLKVNSFEQLCINYVNEMLQEQARISPRLAASPHISPHLPTSPHISPHLPISPHISPYLPTSPLPPRAITLADLPPARLPPPRRQFNESVLAAENRLLAAEGIAVDDGALASSATRLGLMTKLLQSLDDQCRLGERGSDEEFTQQIGIAHTIRGVCQLEQRGTFSINHYAGKVLYTTDGFVLKNADAMHADMQVGAISP